jgi:hypothetical protein
MRRIDARTGKLSKDGGTIYSLASRPREEPIGGSVEAPFPVRHGGYWCLFASFDRSPRTGAAAPGARPGVRPLP